MENFIPLIVILIFIISIVSRIKGAQKPKSGAGPAPSGDLGTKLRAFFSEIQQKLEEQAPSGPSGRSRWERLSTADQTRLPPLPDDEMSLDDLELAYEEAQPTPAPVKKKPLRPAMPLTPPPEELPRSDSGRPGPCTPKPLYAKEAPCPEFLRRAVVWSEILGPPVALRDFFQNRR
jgi:hypothetical protein